MPETVKLTIDGKEVEVPRGTSVLEAARAAGVPVPPHYCYHPGLTVAGNCRMCLVKIEKMPKLVTSCTTQAGEGMVVQTRSPEVTVAIAGVEEFLLANHPLDCPICDQAGECRLQEYSFKHGNTAGRSREPRLQFKKDVEVGPHVVLDCERCIMCTRCVRFCDEISKTGELGVFQRGLHNEIGIFPGKPLDNDYSGNVVDLCPVGALTLKEFRFRKRVWYLRDVPSTCGTCATGCNVNVSVAENQVWRLTPRENREVNGWWMCDEGRLGFQEIQAAERLERPEARRGGSLAAIRMGEAVAALAEALRGAAEGTAAVVASGSLTVEDFWMITGLASAVKGLRVVVPERVRGRNDGFLIRADRTANRTGAAILGLDVDEGGRSSSALMADIAARRVKVVLMLGEDLSTLPGGGDALGSLEEHGTLVAVGPFRTAAARAAALTIPAAAWSELDGTWVNYRGCAQRVRKSVTSRAANLPVWQVLGLVLRELGVEASFDSAAQILREVAGAVPAFEGMSWTALGAGGQQLKPGPGVPEPGPLPVSMTAASWTARGEAGA